MRDSNGKNINTRRLCRTLCGKARPHVEGKARPHVEGKARPHVEGKALPFRPALCLLGCCASAWRAKRPRAEFDSLVTPHAKLTCSKFSGRNACAPVAQRLEQQTHNLLVRGSNPCGGTNQLARVLTFTSSWLLFTCSSIPPWREDGAIFGVRRLDAALVSLTTSLPGVVMRSVPSAVADGFDDPDTLLRLNLTTLADFLRSKRINGLTQIRRRLMSLNTHHP